MTNDEEELRRKVARLNQELADLKSKSLNNDTLELSFQGLETLLLRINAEEIITYVNAALVRYAKVKKEDLLNQDASILQRFFNSDMMNAIVRPDEGDSKTKTVKDGKGCTFEIRTAFNDGLFDIVIQDVSDEQRFRTYVKKYISADLANLTDDDLSTFRYPERRFMTVSFTDLRGFTAMSESLTPEDVRTTMNAYLEEIIHAIDENNATVDKIVGDEVMALYGAPRYYKDHALRAVKTCCEQIFNLKALQKSFARIGKEMPDCGIGINTGDMVIGNMGSSTRQDYTVLSSAVNLAARLCGSARGSEVILTEATLNEVLNVLPKEWDFVIVFEDSEAHKDDVGGKIEGVFPLPADLRRKVVCVGPGVTKNLNNTEYRFQYLHAIKVKGIEENLPVIAVTAPKIRARSLQLDDSDVVVAAGEKVFGKYRLQTLIGRGGMGEVWRARDAFGNNVAVKMLLAGEGASEGQIRRFKREAEAMSRLDHRGICRIHEVGEIDGATYIAMELVEGISLSTLLRHSKSNSGSTSFDTKGSDISTLIRSVEKESTAYDNASIEEKILAPQPVKKITYNILPLQQTLSVIGSVCEAIQYAHERGILHRDLSPGNIMLRYTGEPVLMDFGLAKLEGGQDQQSLSLDGQIFGTIEYMAPEQAASSKDVTESADVYSLGAIFYQMISGQKMFVSSGNILADVQRLQEETPKSPKAHNPSIESDLNVISLKAVRLLPEERYKSALALKEDLDRYKRGEVISAKSATTWEILNKAVQRNKTISVTVFTAIMILFGLSTWFVWSLEKEKNEAIWARDVANRALKDKKLEQIKRKELEAQNKNASAREWHLVLEEDFSDEELFKKRWDVIGNKYIKWRFEKGELVVSGGRSQLVKLRDNFLEKWDTTEIRIDFECHQESLYLNDVTCQIDAYSLVYGGNGNTLNKLEVEGKKKNIWENLPSRPPIKRSALYKVRAERIGNRLRYQVNDKTIFDIKDEHLTDGKKQLLLYSWESEVWYDNIKIYKLGMPRKADLMKIAKQHAQRGNYITARDLYRDILDGTSDPKRRKVAEKGLKFILVLVKNKKYIDEYRQLLKKAWPEKKMRMEINKDGGVLLDISLSNIKDLSPIKGMKLSELICRYNQITTLEPLRGMTSLVKLNCGTNQLTSLEPLRDLKNLTILNCQINQLTSLEPLRNLSNLETLYCDRNRLSTVRPIENLMNLKNIDCSYNQLKNLDPLRALVQLQTLGCSFNKLDNLEPIRNLTNLTFLRCDGNQLITLEPIQNLINLKMLFCFSNNLTTLDPIGHLIKIETLLCFNNKISNLDALKNMTKLSLLNFSRNKVSDVEPLRGLSRLTKLGCGQNRLTNLDPLKKLVNMELLQCYDNQLTSLEPLSGMVKLQGLVCQGNQLTSLEPLQKLLQLTSLFCYDNQITTLEPLRNLHQLKTLACGENKLTSLEALKDLEPIHFSCSMNPLTSFGPLLIKPPKGTFHFDCKTLSDNVLKEAVLEWGKDKRFSKHVRFAKIHLAFRKDDLNSLKSLAETFKGRKILLISRYLTWEAARKECLKLGGRLVIIKNNTENTYVSNKVQFNKWIGIQVDSKKEKTSGKKPPFSKIRVDFDFNKLHGGVNIHRNGNWGVFRFGIDTYKIPKLLGYFIEWDE